MASDSEISCTNDPNFAVIYSFLKVFGKLYGLDVPSIAKFQEYIENSQEVLDPLREIHLRLLRRALKSVQSNKWEKSLIKFCHQHGHHQEAWEMERFSYKKASAPIKLKVLKLLLEYQFTCHPKFKSAVNALSCKDLRLDPIGRDKNGCVYWYQVDDDANLCLYKEDQDEETWQVVARNREELVKVITQLKNGEEVCPLSSNSNEDSSSADIPTQTETKPDEDAENEDEFLSPESESDHEADRRNEKSKSPEKEEQTDTIETKEPIENDKEESKEPLELKDETSINSKPDETSPPEDNENNPKQDETVDDESSKKEEHESVSETIEEPVMIVTGEGSGADCESYFDSDKDIREDNRYFCKNNIGTLDLFEQEFSVSETIEEPLMYITGLGNGIDCETPYIIGEEITEEIMYFFGEGSGYDNDTGNPETIEREHSAEENTDAENGEKSEECINGEHDVPNMTNNTKVVKSIKTKSGVTSVNKRTLKKQNNDTTEVLKSEPKKPCVRSVDPTDCSNSTRSAESATDSREGSVNDKCNTDSETPRKNNVQKGKVKKKSDLAKLKLNDGKEVLNSVNESDNCHDSKSSIIEKRKSSVSSVEQDDHDHAESEKEKSPDKEVKVEDPLPPKKLRLDTPESDVPSPISNETSDSKNISPNEKKSDIKQKVKEEDVENSVSQRKKIKANKGKFKRKRILKIKTENDAEKDDSDNSISNKDKKVNKSLKRSLLDATMSDKNKSESQSDSEDDEPVTSGKRLKIKPKKIITSSRKKVEAKLSQKHSSDESEEETLYSIAGKKSPKKVLKRKPKGKEKGKTKKDAKSQGEKSEDSDAAPVRQSRRIAQMKIKEEAERRLLEEVALREMKMIHKKKNKDDEEEWQASGSSSDGGKVRGVRKRGDKWRGGDSTGPDQDSESDEPLFELHEEPDLIDNTKSDHEFSPESDLETGEPVEPLKRARTLQEGKEDGVCARCGSGEQPEWILLCDKCDAGYHASCLKPMLFLVPEGDWYCPPCNHDMLIASLEKELVKYDELVVQVEAERARRKEEEPEKQSEEDKKEKEDSEEKSHSESDSSSGSSSSGAVYRLRARRQLPVSYRSQEYDRLISSAIKEEYVEPTTSAGNQGRGKDISTIIEAAEEEKMKQEHEALLQGKPVEAKKFRKKTRRKPRKLNSLEVPSEDDDETDEDFKETGVESSSEDISSSAERGSSSDSRSSDDLPIRRTARNDKKDRPKLAESSPEVKKKKKGVFADSSSESPGAEEWSKKEGKKSKSKPRPRSHKSHKSRKSRKHGGLTQYDAAGNVVRARVTYGGLSDEGPNDWSPKHRTRQKKIDYTEMPNTESEDEMHKSSGKHMADSSDEFKVDDSELSSDSDAARAERTEEDKQRALNDLICKTAVVPLEKLPDDVTRAKTEQLEEHLKAQQEAQEAGASSTESTPTSRGRGRGGRGRGGAGRGGRGRGRASNSTDDALAKLVGVKIKDLKTDTPLKPNDIERAKKRQEREAKQAEKEARRVERLQKKEEKEKLKEQKAKEREEKKLAKIALQESKRMKKEKVEFPMSSGYAPRAPPPAGPRLAFPHDFHDQQRFPQQPRLQVRAELRGVAGPEERLHAVTALREGTLSVAGSPQPFKPVTEEPSIITRMPHMMNQQYRGPMMYPPGNSPYGPRGQNMMYPMHHPGMNPGARHQYPPGYYPPHMRGLPPSYPPTSSPGPHLPPGHPAHRQLGPPPHMPPAGPQPALGHMPGGPPPSSSPHGPNSHHGIPGHPLHGHLRPTMGPPHGAHGPHGPPPHGHGSPGPSSLGAPPPRTPSAGSPAHPPTPPAEPPIKIKAEVKTEPEYRTPPSSPRPPSPRDDPPRHPKIKHTENKDRRPRFPLGPYAPQYGPYGPYAPPGAAPDGHAPLMMSRPPPPGPHPLHRMQQLHRLLPAGPGPGERPPRPDMSYLAAHIRASRPPFFPPPDRSSPAGPPHYSSPYADPQRSALSNQLAAPPMPPQQREHLERLSSPAHRGTPTPPSAAAGPGPPGPATSPAHALREEQGRIPPAPRDVAPPYMRPSDGNNPPYMKPSDSVGPPYLKQNDAAASPYLKSNDGSVAPPYLKPSETVAPPYLKPNEAVAPPYLKPGEAATPPFLKPNEAIAPNYLKPGDAVVPPYLKPGDAVAPPYLKPSEAAAPPYLKQNEAVAPPYLKPSEAVAQPHLKQNEAVAPPYLKQSEAVAPPYLKTSEGVAQPHLKQNEAVAPPYLKQSEAVAPPYLKTSEGVAPPYLKPSEAVAPLYLKPSEAVAPPYLKPSEAVAPPYLKPSEGVAPPYLKPGEAVAPPYLKQSEAVSPAYLKPSEESPGYLKPVETAPPYVKPETGSKGPELPPVKEREEGSVFGGLVSYFSSQQEDDEA